MLSDPGTPRLEKQKILKILNLNNFSESINLLAYSLMPNHFHLLVKQKDPQSIDIFMNSLCTRYTMYFNRRHKRVGSLYQDVYKAANVDKDEYLLHLSRYIHIQATNITEQGVPLFKQPSSLSDYLETNKTLWVKKEEILSYFQDQYPERDYLSFISGKENVELATDLTLDEE